MKKLRKVLLPIVGISVPAVLSSSIFSISAIKANEAISNYEISFDNLIVENNVTLSANNLNSFDNRYKPENILKENKKPGPNKEWSSTRMNGKFNSDINYLNNNGYYFSITFHKQVDIRTVYLNLGHYENKHKTTKYHIELLDSTNQRLALTSSKLEENGYYQVFNTFTLNGKEHSLIKNVKKIKIYFESLAFTSYNNYFAILDNVQAFSNTVEQKYNDELEKIINYDYLNNGYIQTSADQLLTHIRPLINKSNFNKNFKMKYKPYSDDNAVWDPHSTPVHVQYDKNDYNEKIKNINNLIKKYLKTYKQEILDKIEEENNRDFNFYETQSVDLYKNTLLRFKNEIEPIAQENFKQDKYNEYLEKINQEQNQLITNKQYLINEIQQIISSIKININVPNEHKIEVENGLNKIINENINTQTNIDIPSFNSIKKKVYKFLQDNLLEIITKEKSKTHYWPGKYDEFGKDYLDFELEKIKNEILLDAETAGYSYIEFIKKINLVIKKTVTTKNKITELSNKEKLKFDINLYPENYHIQINNYVNKLNEYENNIADDAKWNEEKLKFDNLVQTYLPQNIKKYKELIIEKLNQNINKENDNSLEFYDINSIREYIQENKNKLQEIEQQTEIFNKEKYNRENTTISNFENLLVSNKTIILKKLNKALNYRDEIEIDLYYVESILEYEEKTRRLYLDYNLDNYSSLDVQNVEQKIEEYKSKLLTYKDLLKEHIQNKKIESKNNIPNYDQVSYNEFLEKINSEIEKITPSSFKVKLDNYNQEKQLVNEWFLSIKTYKNVILEYLDSQKNDAANILKIYYVSNTDNFIAFINDKINNNESLDFKNFNIDSLSNIRNVVASYLSNLKTNKSKITELLSEASQLNLEIYNSTSTDIYTSKLLNLTNTYSNIEYLISDVQNVIVEIENIKNELKTIKSDLLELLESKKVQNEEIYEISSLSKFKKAYDELKMEINTAIIKKINQSEYQQKISKIVKNLITYKEFTKSFITNEKESIVKSNLPYTNDSKETFFQKCDELIQEAIAKEESDFVKAQYDSFKEKINNSKNDLVFYKTYAINWFNNQKVLEESKKKYYFNFDEEAYKNKVIGIINDISVQDQNSFKEEHFNNQKSILNMYLSGLTTNKQEIIRLIQNAKLKNLETYNEHTSQTYTSNINSLLISYNKEKYENSDIVNVKLKIKEEINKLRLVKDDLLNKLDNDKISNFNIYTLDSKSEYLSKWSELKSFISDTSIIITKENIPTYNSKINNLKTYLKTYKKFTLDYLNNKKNRFINIKNSCEINSANEFENQVEKLKQKLLIESENSFIISNYENYKNEIDTKFDNLVRLKNLIIAELNNKKNNFDIETQYLFNANKANFDNTIDQILQDINLINIDDYDYTKYNNAYKRYDQHISSIKTNKQRIIELINEAKNINFDKYTSISENSYLNSLEELLSSHNQEKYLALEVNKTNETIRKIFNQLVLIQKELLEKLNTVKITKFNIYTVSSKDKYLLEWTKLEQKIKNNEIKKNNIENYNNEIDELIKLLDFYKNVIQEYIKEKNEEFQKIKNTCEEQSSLDFTNKVLAFKNEIEKIDKNLYTFENFEKNKKEIDQNFAKLIRLKDLMISNLANKKNNFYEETKHYFNIPESSFNSFLGGLVIEISTIDINLYTQNEYNKTNNKYLEYLQSFQTNKAKILELITSAQSKNLEKYNEPSSNTYLNQLTALNEKYNEEDYLKTEIDKVVSKIREISSNLVLIQVELLMKLENEKIIDFNPIISNSASNYLSEWEKTKQIIENAINITKSNKNIYENKINELVTTLKYYKDEAILYLMYMKSKYNDIKQTCTRDSALDFEQYYNALENNLKSQDKNTFYLSNYDELKNLIDDKFNNLKRLKNEIIKFFEYKKNNFEDETKYLFEPSHQEFNNFIENILTKINNFPLLSYNMDIYEKDIESYQEFLNNAKTNKDQILSLIAIANNWDLDTKTVESSNEYLLTLKSISNAYQDTNYILKDVENVAKQLKEAGEKLVEIRDYLKLKMENGKVIDFSPYEQDSVQEYNFNFQALYRKISNLSTKINKQNQQNFENQIEGLFGILSSFKSKTIKYLNNVKNKIIKYQSSYDNISKIEFDNTLLELTYQIENIQNKDFNKENYLEFKEKITNAELKIVTIKKLTIDFFEEKKKNFKDETKYLFDPKQDEFNNFVDQQIQKISKIKFSNFDQTYANIKKQEYQEYIDSYITNQKKILQNISESKEIDLSIYNESSMLEYLNALTNLNLEYEGKYNLLQNEVKVIDDKIIEITKLLVLAKTDVLNYLEDKKINDFTSYRPNAEADYLELYNKLHNNISNENTIILRSEIEEYKFRINSLANILKSYKEAFLTQLDNEMQRINNNAESYTLDSKETFILNVETIKNDANNLGVNEFSKEQYHLYNEKLKNELSKLYSIRDKLIELLENKNDDFENVTKYCYKPNKVNYSKFINKLIQNAKNISVFEFNNQIYEQEIEKFNNYISGLITNKQKMITLINNANSLDQNIYTETSWNSYIYQFETIKNKYNDDNYTKNIVEILIHEIKTAQSILVLVKKEVQEKLDEIISNHRILDEYTPESIVQFLTVIEDVKSKLNDENISITRNNKDEIIREINDFPNLLVVLNKNYLLEKIDQKINEFNKYIYENNVAESYLEQATQIKQQIQDKMGALTKNDLKFFSNQIEKLTPPKNTFKQKLLNYLINSEKNLEIYTLESTNIYIEKIRIKKQEINNLNEVEILKNNYKEQLNEIIKIKNVLISNKEAIISYYENTVKEVLAYENLNTQQKENYKQKSDKYFKYRIKTITQLSHDEAKKIKEEIDNLKNNLNDYSIVPLPQENSSKNSISQHLWWIIISSVFTLGLTGMIIGIVVSKKKNKKINYTEDYDVEFIEI